MAEADHDAPLVPDSSSDSDLSLPLENSPCDDPEVEDLNPESDGETAGASGVVLESEGVAADDLPGVVHGTPFEDQDKQEALRQLRMELQEKDREQVNLWLFNHLHTHKAPLRVLLGEKVKSAKKWCQLVGVSLQRVCRLQGLVKKGLLALPPDGRKNRCRVYSNVSTEQVDAFLGWLHANVAEPLAEGIVVDNEQDDQALCTGTAAAATLCELDRALPCEQEVRYLAPGTVWELYEQFVTWVEDLASDRKPASWRTFYRVHAKWKKVLKFRRDGQHQKCADCCRYREFRKNAHGSEMLLKLNKALSGHLQIMRKNRNLYKTMCMKSEMLARTGSTGNTSGADAVLVICLDGMDQAKFRCPRDRAFNRSKESDSLFMPQLHFTGGIAHGVAEYYFVQDSDFRKDGNVVCEQISFILDHVMGGTCK